MDLDEVTFSSIVSLQSNSRNRVRATRTSDSTADHRFISLPVFLDQFSFCYITTHSILRGRPLQVDQGVDMGKSVQIAFIAHDPPKTDCNIHRDDEQTTDICLSLPPPSPALMKLTLKQFYSHYCQLNSPFLFSPKSTFTTHSLHYLGGEYKLFLKPKKGEKNKERNE